MPPSSSSPPQDPETLDDLSTAYDRLRQEIGKVIVGQEDIIEMVVVCLMARGHTLLIGVPGLAKTLLVRTLAGALDLDFSRIQFTPDLMPSDITGTEIIQDTQDGRHFEFAAGPVFANVILADEINRTPPKTQAALLEAMQEQHVTAAGETHTLDDPFFVLATQNPIEQEGTYPLPEAQLDRFMLNLWLDYPSFDEETEVVRSTTAGPQSEVSPVMSADELQSYQEFVRQIPVADNVIEYAVQLVTLTRPDSGEAPEFIQDYLSYGAGPRASQYLVLGAKTLSALDGRMTPVEDDVRRMAVPVLRHRIVPSFNAEADDVSSVDLIDQLLDEM
ncbi:MoxR-like ATPase [Salinibacter ruber]|uniref:AAA family ATPase n=1 Tax=Salinibacter ruber TaxID=146919 RepID=UPI0021686372|nr:MoxR family ATPase [Salinibacter ruber]MCS3863098.1 MoxR-like ATPase [Salinibacter ruber]